MNFTIETPDGKPSDMATEVTNGNAHYFCGSGSNWKVGTCALTIMNAVKAYDKRSVKSRGMASTNLVLIYVPLPLDSRYEIGEYVPVVDNMIVLARVNYADELRKYAARINKAKTS